MDSTRDWDPMRTKLDLITKVAQREDRCKIENVAYLLDELNLRRCFWMLKRGKAAGVDGVVIEEYEKNLEANVKGLVERMKRRAYKPQPVRRTYIPKSNGKLRPLGIPTVEDKIVQTGIARILEAIYEGDFLDFSYGFRPGRNCHQTLKRLDQIIMQEPINYVIDADIKGFFDNVDHQWMMKFLAHRISDPPFLHLITRFLKNGYMEEGRVYDSEKGTPQGGIVSPILANIYLHYVLDLWMEHVVKPNCRGVVEMVRYADDFVICVQYKEDAERILKGLKNRLNKYNLELAEEKTRLIEFGRKSSANAEKQDKKPETFNFLGFTHYVGKSRFGRFKLGRKTDQKKMNAKLKEVNLWLQEVRNLKSIKEWWILLKAKLEGHFRYYGVSDNIRSMETFYYRVVRMVYKWINRRSQRSSKTWETFGKYLKWYQLPKPKIWHNLYSN